MTTEEIKALNASGKYDTWEQGIFTEPNHIPTTVKEPVVFMRWNAFGTRGGSCWMESSDELEDYYNDRPTFDALIATCKYLYPGITDKEIRMIEGLATEEDGGYDHEYYGNATNYKVEWVRLSEVEKWIDIFKKQ